MTTRKRAKNDDLEDAFEMRAGQEGDRPVAGVDVGKTTERTAPVNLTITLEFAIYNRLETWLAAQTSALGRKVDKTKIGSALFSELLGDPELQERVIERVRMRMRK